MGTRATLTIFQDPARTKPITRIFRSMDGYPSEAGAQLHAHLRRLQLTNGYTRHYEVRENERWVNGMGHLAAVATGAWLMGNGTCHVLAPDEGGSDEWEYDLFPASNPYEANQDTNPVGILLRVATFGEQVWLGLVAEFDGAAIKSID